MADFGDVLRGRPSFNSRSHVVFTLLSGRWCSGTGPGPDELDETAASARVELPPPFHQLRHWDVSTGSVLTTSLSAAATSSHTIRCKFIPGIALYSMSWVFVKHHRVSP